MQEITVTASKVKFYNRGDTIVYNADAFITAEGSMLDALIRQLPGVELKEGGAIYVNGRYVESLMLNGKDFFKGNNKLMLENLAAYTVKNIEVYERQQEIDRIVGADFGKKLLTMDVKLKKEYNQGFILNADAGYGTSDRYLGKLFAMWFADHARVSLIGNANNLNDVRKPGNKPPSPLRRCPQALSRPIWEDWTTMCGAASQAGTSKGTWWSNIRDSPTASAPTPPTI